MPGASSFASPRRADSRRQRCALDLLSRDVGHRRVLDERHSKGESEPNSTAATSGSCHSTWFRSLAPASSGANGSDPGAATGGKQMPADTQSRARCAPRGIAIVHRRLFVEAITRVAEAGGEAARAEGARPAVARSGRPQWFETWVGQFYPEHESFALPRAAAGDRDGAMRLAAAVADEVGLSTRQFLPNARTAPASASLLTNAARVAASAHVATSRTDLAMCATSLVPDVYAGRSLEPVHHRCGNATAPSVRHVRARRDRLRGRWLRLSHGGPARP
jgi:hypothetical protein